MLARRFVKKLTRKKNDPSSPKRFDRSGLVVPIAIIMILAVIIMQIIGTPNKHIHVPMLAKTDGLVELKTIEQIDQYSDTFFILPTQQFESDLTDVGVYTQPDNDIPTGTIALVYIRDGWRYAEIDFKPLSLDEQRAIIINRQINEVALSEETTGFFLSRNTLGQCVGAGTEDYPGKCEIDRQLFFALSDVTVVISGTNKHITEGEMIEIAKSILEEERRQKEN
jgi:hypothetical protein